MPVTESQGLLRKEDIVLPLLRPDEVDRSLFRVGPLPLVETPASMTTLQPETGDKDPPRTISSKPVGRRARTVIGMRNGDPLPTALRSKGAALSYTERRVATGIVVHAHDAIAWCGPF
jgi:hypothetical protein